MNPLIVANSPILRFSPGEKHYPISLDTLLADGSIDGQTFTPSISLMEIGTDFEKTAPTYFRQHQIEGDSDRQWFQYLWAFYPICNNESNLKQIWVDCVVEIVDDRPVRLRCNQVWYSADEFKFVDTHPVLYVTRQSHLLYPHCDCYFSHLGVHHTISGGKEFTGVLTEFKCGIKNWGPSTSSVPEVTDGDTIHSTSIHDLCFVLLFIIVLIIAASFAVVKYTIDDLHLGT